MEDLGDLRVHGDDVVALQGDPLVAGVDLESDPVLERLSYDGVDNVG